jgi:HlyD family secretion protein
MSAARRLPVLLLVLAVLAALAGGAWWFSRPKPIEVALYTVALGTVEERVTNTRAGEVKACRRARLAPHSGGQIVMLAVKEGDRVRAGQVLMELWSGDVRAELDQAQAQIEAARARSSEACLLADNAAREAERAASLVAKGFLSQEAADRASAEARARSATCAASRADVAQGEARVRVLGAHLSRTKLLAPFAGVVAEVTGELGEFVTPSPPGIPTPPAVDLIDDACLYVTAPVDEVDAPRMRVNQPARILLDAYPGKTFPGHVRRIAPYVLALEKQARTVEVEVAFGDPGQARVLVGLSADVEVLVARHDGVIVAPTGALMEGAGKSGEARVLAFDAKSGTLIERAVTTGASNWEVTRIVSGLVVGERILADFSREDVKAGTHVTPAP